MLLFGVFIISSVDINSAIAVDIVYNIVIKEIVVSVVGLLIL